MMPQQGADLRVDSVPLMPTFILSTKTARASEAFSHIRLHGPGMSQELVHLLCYSKSLQDLLLRLFRSWYAEAGDACLTESSEWPLGQLGQKSDVE